METTLADILTILAALYWLATWGALGSWIGARMAGRTGAGLALGMLLGPLGCALALTLEPSAPEPDPLRAMAAAHRLRRPASAASGPTVPCPCCKAALSAADLAPGPNTCPACSGEFAVER